MIRDVDIPDLISRLIPSVLSYHDIFEVEEVNSNVISCLAFIVLTFASFHAAHKTGHIIVSDETNSPVEL